MNKLFVARKVLKSNQFLSIFQIDQPCKSHGVELIKKAQTIEWAITMKAIIHLKVKVSLLKTEITLFNS